MPHEESIGCFYGFVFVVASVIALGWAAFVGLPLTAWLITAGILALLLFGTSDWFVRRAYLAAVASQASRTAARRRWAWFLANAMPVVVPVITVVLAVQVAGP